MFYSNRRIRLAFKKLNDLQKGGDIREFETLAYDPAKMPSHRLHRLSVFAHEALTPRAQIVVYFYLYYSSFTPTTILSTIYLAVVTVFTSVINSPVAPE
jgi:hypothetical protein